MSHNGLLCENINNHTYVPAYFLKPQTLACSLLQPDRSSVKIIANLYSKPKSETHISKYFHQPSTKVKD